MSNIPSSRKVVIALVATVWLATLPAAAFAQAGLNVFATAASSNTVVPFVTNSNGTLSPFAAIAVGNFPHYIAVTPDGRFAYVSNRDSNNISVISSASLTVIQTIAASNSPFGVAVTPDGSKVVVANRLPPAGCVGPTCSPLIQVFSRDTSTGLLTLSTTISTINGAQLRDITVLQDGHSLYVVDQANNRVLVASLQSNTVQASIAVGNQPLGIASNPAGTRVYVANFTSASISVIDTATRIVVATPASGSNGTFKVDVTPNGQFFYSANASGQTVSQFNALTNTAIAAPISTGQDPDGLTVSPDGANLYVTNASNSDVVAFYSINATTGALTATGTVAAGNDPVAISMRHVVILPPPPPSPPVSGPEPSRPSAPWVGVRRHNLALKVDFAAPEIGKYDPELTYKVYVIDTNLYPVATVHDAIDGVVIPYIRNEQAYWVSVTASNRYGEGPAPWVFVPAPDWAFYPKDRDGRPCPTPAQCQ